MNKLEKNKEFFSQSLAKHCKPGTFGRIVKLLPRPRVQLN